MLQCMEYVLICLQQPHHTTPHQQPPHPTPHQQPHHTTNHTTSLPALQVPHCFCCCFLCFCGILYWFLLHRRRWHSVPHIPALPGPRQHINIWDADTLTCLAMSHTRQGKGHYPGRPSGKEKEDSPPKGAISRPGHNLHVSKYPLASAPWPRFPRALKHFRSERRGISESPSKRG